MKGEKKRWVSPPLCRFLYCIVTLFFFLSLERSGITRGVQRVIDHVPSRNTRLILKFDQGETFASTSRGGLYIAAQRFVVAGASWTTTDKGQVGKVVSLFVMHTCAKSEEWSKKDVMVYPLKCTDHQVGRAVFSSCAWGER